MASICSKHLLFSWKRSCFTLRTSSGLACHLIRSFLRAQRALMTPHTTRQQVDVNTPTSLRTTFKNAPDASRWSAKTTCRSAGTARERRVGHSRRCKRRRVIYITTSGPKRRYEYVSSSVQAKSGFWRSLRGLSTRTLCGRRRRNILFASFLASEWSWVNLLLTQGHSGSLRISDPTGQGQSWKQHFIQGRWGSLRIAPIGWVGSFVESGPGSPTVPDYIRHHVCRLNWFSLNQYGRVKPAQTLT